MTEWETSPPVRNDAEGGPSMLRADDTRAIKRRTTQVVPASPRRMDIKMRSNIG